MKKKYPIEDEAAKLLRELRRTIERLSRWLFIIPKRKDDKIVYMFELLAWFSLTIALVLRIWR